MISKVVQKRKSKKPRMTLTFKVEEEENPVREDLKVRLMKKIVGGKVATNGVSLPDAFICPVKVISSAFYTHMYT